MKKIKKLLEKQILDSNRINSLDNKYWYPLSMATYDVDEILEALDSMCNFRTTMWNKTEAFENDFSKYQNCFSSVMVNSGSSADLLLMFLLREKCINTNDDRKEVLISSVTWPTQIWSIIVAGFKPILVDVDPNILNTNYDDLESKINSNTVAIFAVHLMGNPCDMDMLLKLAKEKELYILEDCCEGLGSSFDGIKIGNFGLGAAFSFFFSHHITTMEGGMVTCTDQESDDLLRVFRAHGWTRNVKNKKTYNDIDPRYTFINIGFNFRPTDVQAGFGIHQIKKLPAFNKKRDDIAKKFFSFIDSSELFNPILVHHKSKVSWLGLPMMLKTHENRNKMVSILEANGVETRPIVAGNVARHPVFDKFNVRYNLPGADIVNENGLYIGLSPMQKDNDIDKVIDIIMDFENENT